MNEIFVRYNQSHFITLTISVNIYKKQTAKNIPYINIQEKTWLNSCNFVYYMYFYECVTSLSVIHT